MWTKTFKRCSFFATVQLISRIGNSIWIAKGWGCITNPPDQNKLISHANNLRTHIFIPRLFCMEHLGVIRIFSLKTADLHLFLLSPRRKVVEYQTLAHQPEKIKERVDRKTGGARIWLGEENCCYVPYWTTTSTLTMYACSKLVCLRLEGIK